MVKEKNYRLNKSQLEIKVNTSKSCYTEKIKKSSNKTLVHFSSKYSKGSNYQIYPEIRAFNIFPLFFRTYVRIFKKGISSLRLRLDIYRKKRESERKIIQFLVYK